MTLKDHLGFKYVHDNKFLGQSKDKIFVLKVSVYFIRSGVNCVKRMHVGGDMENSWKMFDHVKHLKDWTTLMCHVYYSKYCKVLTIICCDLHFEGGAIQDFFLKNLHSVMTKNENVNFKGFMRIVHMPIECSKKDIWWRWSKAANGRSQAHLSFPLIAKFGYGYTKLHLCIIFAFEWLGFWYFHYR